MAKTDLPALVESREAASLTSYAYVAFLLNIDRGSNGTNDNVIHRISCPAVGQMGVKTEYGYVGSDTVSRLQEYAAKRGFPCRLCERCNPE
jgi:hypothetical protein